MKKALCLLLVLSLFLAQFSCLAEEKDGGGVLDSIGGFFSNAGKAVNDKLNDAGQAIGDAKENIGDALHNAGEKAGDYWNQTVDTVNDTWNRAGAFVGETGKAVSENVGQKLDDLNAWFSNTGKSATELLHAVFDWAARGLGVAAETVSRLWDSIYKFSVENGIGLPELVKLTLAIIVRFTLGEHTIFGKMAQDYIDRTALRWIANFGLKDPATAAKSLAGLKELSGIVLQGKN